MTLHEAILTVLKNNNKPMTARDITLAINNYDLYKREDEQPITVSQVWARVSNYSDTLFVIDEDKLILSNEGYSPEFDSLINSFRNTVRERTYEGKSMELLMTLLLVDYYLNIEQYRDNLKIDNLRDKLVDIINSLKSYNLQNSFYEGLITDNHQLWKDDYEYLSDVFASIKSIFDNLSKYQVLSLIRKFIAQNKTFEKNIENFTPPKILTEYISKIAEIRDGQTVLDPLAHNSSLLPELAFSNIDFNIEIWSFNLVGKSYDIYELILAEKKFNFIYDSDPFETINDGLYDWVVTVPPFGYIPRDLKTTRQSSANSYPYVYEKLNEKGKAIIIVNETFLYSTYSENNNFIRFLLKNNALKAVISLPKGFYRGIYTAAFFIEKNSGNNNIFFGDYSQFTPEEFGYKLDDLVHWQKNQAEIASISINIDSSEFINKDIIDLTPRKAILSRTLNQSLQEGYRRLKELVLNRIPGKSIPGINLNTDNEGIPYLRISDLNNDPDFVYLVTPPQKYVAYNKRPEAKERETEIDDKNNKLLQASKVKEGTVILARFGTALKATVYSCDEPAIPSHHLMCFEVDSSVVDAGYLVSELYTEYIRKQLSAIQITGVGAPHYHEKDLLEIRIKIPSLEEQKKIMQDKKEKVMETFFSKTSIEKNIAKNKESILDKSILEKEIISSIQHRISQYVSPVSNDIMNLRYYYLKKSEEGSIVSVEDRISGRPNAATIFETFDRIENNLNGIADTFKLMSEVLFYNSAAVNFKDSNVFELIQEASDSVKDRMEGVDFIQDSWLKLDADKTISLAPNQFIELLRNFFINSVKHGFNGVKTDKVIYVKITKSEDDDYLEIHLINNGLPFPDGFKEADFTNFGTKGTQSEGTGIGGYLMKKIVENHNGKFEWLCDERQGVSIDLEEGTLKIVANVYFKISLPYIN